MSISTIIIWIILGAISGWVASLIMGTDKNMGFLQNVFVGLVGSIIGGALMVLLTQGRLGLTDDYSNLNWGSFLVSIIGAVIFIWLVRMFKNNSTDNFS